MRFVPGIEVTTHLLLYIFSCILITGNSMVSRAIWKNIHSRVFQRLQITLVLQTNNYNSKALFRYLSIMHYHYFALFQQAGILSALVNNFRRIQKLF